MKLNKKTAGIIMATIAALALVFVLIFTVNGDRNTEKMRCELYFLNIEANALVSEQREIKYLDEETLYTNIVVQLIRGPETVGYKSVIDKDAKLINIEDGHNGGIIVNFSEGFLTNDNTKNALSTYAVVKSLCALDSVERVKVTVENEDLTNDDGSKIDYLTSEDINLPSDTYTSETRSITLYFPEKNTDKLRKEEQTVKVTDQQPVEQYIINALIKGTENGELNPALDSNTKLLSVYIYDDLCFVNFKSDFIAKNSGSETKEKTAVYSVVNSLTELNNIKRVQFLMDGKKVSAFGGTDISNPITRDESILQ